MVLIFFKVNIISKTATVHGEKITPLNVDNKMLSIFFNFKLKSK